MRKDVNYLTPQELIDKYGVVENTLFWDARGVGIFLKSGLLIGKIVAHEKKYLINEDSFLMLMKYADFLKELQKANQDYSKIDDIMKRFK